MAWIEKKDPISGHVTKTYTSGSSSKPSGSGSKPASSAPKTSSSGSSGQKLYSDGYGGWTSTPSTSQEYAKNYGGSSKTVTSSPGVSAAKPVSGGTSGSPSGTPAAGRDYHQEARDAAAVGDWNKVAKALAARQAKIDAQGGNDRGTSNAQILAALQQQYASSYKALSPTVQNTVQQMASGATTGRGWEDGHDYLAEAQALAQAGDLDAAYDALTRRGFKMYDTGAAGGGTSQDQAYALIRQLYNQSANAAHSYQSEVQRNAQLLAEHPTQFGTGTIPALANKHFVSADNQYIIYYDASGTPVAAKPNSAGAYSRQYSPGEIDLMRQYYSGGSDTDFAELQRLMHNNNVAYTGNGRLIAPDGSWASGAPVGTTGWYDWDPSTIPGAELNVNQDKDVLRDILAQINGGQTFDSPLSVPQAVKNTLDYSGLPGTVSGGVGGYSGYGGTPSGGVPGGMPGASDLGDVLRQMYAQNLEAQLAGLRSTYEQNRADIQAQDDLISRIYQEQRNQAAAQNDIQRMQLAEFGLGQGLNTGTAGQLALAQSAALQGGLAEIGGAEAQSLAENALLLQKLTSAYRGDMDQAAAQSGAQLADALYGEYVRQIGEQADARAAELAQQNWLAQFDYQKQQDALAQANWERQYADSLGAAEADRAYEMQKLLFNQSQAQADQASDWVQMLLKGGAMPDQGLLDSAGLSSDSAQALVDAYWRALNIKNAPKSSSKSGGSGGTSGAGKPKLSLAQAMSMIERGEITPSVTGTYDYYMGPGAYEQYYGQQGGDTGSGDSGRTSFDYNANEGILTWNGKPYARVGDFARDVETANLTSAEKTALQRKMGIYGIDVEF